MIHVCSLARLHATVEETGALHVVTLLKDTDRVERPRSIVPANHLILGMDDISTPMDGYIIPADDHVTRLIEFVRLTQSWPESSIDPRVSGASWPRMWLMQRKWSRQST